MRFVSTGPPKIPLTARWSFWAVTDHKCVTLTVDSPLTGLQLKVMLGGAAWWGMVTGAWPGRAYLPPPQLPSASCHHVPCPSSFSCLMPCLTARQLWMESAQSVRYDEPLPLRAVDVDHSVSKRSDEDSQASFLGQ